MNDIKTHGHHDEIHRWAVDAGGIKGDVTAQAGQCLIELSFGGTIRANFDVAAGREFVSGLRAAIQQIEDGLWFAEHGRLK